MSVVSCGGCVGVPLRLLPRSPSLQSFTGAAPVLRPRSPLVGAVSRHGVGVVLGGGCGCCSGRLVSLGGPLWWRRRAGVPGLEREGSAPFNSRRNSALWTGAAAGRLAAHAGGRPTSPTKKKVRLHQHCLGCHGHTNVSATDLPTGRRKLQLARQL